MVFDAADRQLFALGVIDDAVNVSVEVVAEIVAQEMFASFGCEDIMQVDA
jgi:hypothetical protein